MSLPVDYKYFLASSALSAAHVFGTSWPPSSFIQRDRNIGHWGANPGIAWIVGHLANAHRYPEPLKVICGTGHASSFFLSHKFLRGELTIAKFNEAIISYGQTDGTPSELLDEPGGALSFFGEIGSALAVSQGFAAASRKWVVVILGDGELETPRTLGALVHFQKLQEYACGRLLVAINGNGAKMGSSAYIDPIKICQLGKALGYETIVSV